MMAAVALWATIATQPPAAKADPPRCTNPLARMLNRAGFKGPRNRTAWAIVMRESNGQNLQPGYAAFNGHDWGIWQVNQPTWGNASWWSTEAMTTPARQTRIVYRYLTKHGTDWRSWGLNSDGTGMDLTWYSMWTSAQQSAWIWDPYVMWRNKYPEACAS